jgi:hypothetical protein
VAWRLADGEAVVLHADTSAYFGMNQIGTILWLRLAEQPMTLDALATWAQGGFSSVPPGFHDEIAAFLDQLRDGELVVAEEIPGAGAPLGKHAPDHPLVPWETPVAECFGELEQLILSGE